MRRVIVYVVASILLAITMHIVPYACDCFYVVEYEGKLVKVFARGWPISYVFEGVFCDSPWAIASKLLANTIAVASVLLLVRFVWDRARRRVKSHKS